MTGQCTPDDFVLFCFFFFSFEYRSPWCYNLFFFFFKEPERGIFTNKVTFPEAEKPGSMSILPNSFGYSSGGPRVPRRGCQGPEGTEFGFAGAPVWCGLPPTPTPVPGARHSTTPGAPTTPAPGRVSLYYLGGLKGNLE